MKLPLQKSDVSPATAPEKWLDDVKHTFVGRPQEEGMKQCSSKFSLSMKPSLSNLGGVVALLKVVNDARKVCLKGGLDC